MVKARYIYIYIYINSGRGLIVNYNYLYHRQIGYELNRTLAKLEQLTECEIDYYTRNYHVLIMILYVTSIIISSYVVARGRSLFGDPTSEIQKLTFVIKDDIAKLNSDIASLQQVTRTQAASGRTGKHTKSHSGAVVISLQVN